MQAQALLKSGDPTAALAALEQQVRKAPADAKQRIFLFQLLSVLGNWDRALAQLNVAAEMDPTYLLDAQLYRAALQCEAFRAQVFRGERAPLIFGEPEAWVGSLVQAAQLQAKGEHAAAVKLRAQALEAAPATPGMVDGASFTWIMDADPRLGPVFEMLINGRYFWVPMHRVARLSIEPPVELRDAVWSMAQVQWSNGGEAAVLMPARYPGSESAGAALQMARQTDWVQLGPDLQEGKGQRLFATDEGDMPQLEVREIVFAGRGPQDASAQGESMDVSGGQHA
ncbi:type VI secretion system accessory protein TagJ [soil metagenome]